MRRSIRNILPGVLAGLLILATGCRRESAVWNHFVEQTVEQYFAMHPDVAVHAGRHDYDGQVPDFSKEALQLRWAWLTARRQTAARFSAETLSEAQRFERDYLVAVLDGKLFWLDDARWPARSPNYYSGAINPSIYVSRDYAPLAERMRAFTDMAGKVPAVAAHVKANLETPLPITYLRQGRIAFGGLADFFADDIPAVFAAVEDAALQEVFAESLQVAVAALRDLDAWLEAQEASATGDFAFGPELYRKMLWKTGRIDMDLALLEAIGRLDLARNRAALLAACAELAPGASIEDCLALVMNDKPADGPVEEARRQLSGLKAVVESQRLVSIPGAEEVLVEVSPPFMRWNAAFISIPGPFEEGLPSVYYISPADPSWSGEDQLAYIPGKNDLMFISVHEVWPGHFLNRLHRNRSGSLIGRLFGNYAYTEGWAHYAEELMWEAGLGDGDPAVHIGQLLNALLRNVRFLVSIGMHTQGMTVAEAERMFREEAYQDPGNARQQAARGTFDPGYLNYTLGKLMIRQLRRDWTASRGGRESWQKFHDTFLSYGAPPIPLVRQAMLGPEAGPLLGAN